MWALQFTLLCTTFKGNIKHASSEISILWKVENVGILDYSGPWLDPSEDPWSQT